MSKNTEKPTAASLLRQAEEERKWGVDIRDRIRVMQSTPETMVYAALDKLLLELDESDLRYEKLMRRYRWWARKEARQSYHDNFPERSE